MTPILLVVASVCAVLFLAGIVAELWELYANRNQARRRQHDPRYWR